MKTTRINLMTTATLTSLAALFFSIPALASDAETTARATAGRGRSGSATATAHYEGDVGFTRTDTRTGTVNAARAVAIGVDEDGISLSFSLALAPRNGPAFATNFNLSFENDGGVATSFGTARANGGTTRAVSAGGRSTATPYGPAATSIASGNTAHGGVVRVAMRSNIVERREVRPIRVIRIR